MSQCKTCGVNKEATLESIKRIQAENAAMKEQVAALGIENSHLCVANGELKEQVAQLQESIEELTRKYQKHSGNYYASQDALAKLQSKSAALVDTLSLVVFGEGDWFNLMPASLHDQLCEALAAFKGESDDTRST